MNRRDRHHARAIERLASHAPLVTSDLVVVETWLLTNSRIDFPTAELFLKGISNSSCQMLRATSNDWQQSSRISSDFPDQTFSIVDRLSFAIMERLGISDAISFDNDFVIYRCGAERTRAFSILR